MEDAMSEAHVGSGDREPDPGEEEIVEAEIVEDAPALDGLSPPPAKDEDHLGTVISDDVSPSFQEIRFRLEPSAAVSPGEFVAVEVRAPGDGLAAVGRP